LPACLPACLILAWIALSAPERARAQTWQTDPVAIRYVDPTATGGLTGVDWVNAFQSLDQALDPTVNTELNNPLFTVPFMEIRIKEGVHVPQSRFPAGSADPRHATFLFHPRVLRLHGGWAGTENPVPLSTPLNNNPTILSGELAPGLHAYHVVSLRTYAGDEAQWLKNLTVTGGSADGDSAQGIDQLGGGVLALSTHCRLVDVSIEKCHTVYGGGVAVARAGTQSAAVQFYARGSRFEGNSSKAEGGGIWTREATRFILTNCSLVGNVTAGHGAGLHFDWANRFSIIQNGVFHDNSAEVAGGAIYVEDPDPLGQDQNRKGPGIVNCTIAYNSAGDAGGAGVYVELEARSLPPARLSTTLICNSILYANPGSSNSDNLYLALPPPGVEHSIDVSNSFLGKRRPDQALAPLGQIGYLFGVTAPITSLGYIDAGASGELPGWANPPARQFWLKLDSRCIDQGTDTVFNMFYGSDHCDLDEDGLYTSSPAGDEPLPREFRILNSDAVTDTTREVFVQGAGTTMNPQIGVDGGAVMGRVTDIGAYEYRVNLGG